MFKQVAIKYDTHEFEGHMLYGETNKAWIIFAHGSGSSRRSKRNNWVAQELNKLGFATLLFDLLTPDEDTIYLNRFNIPLLSDRLLAATSWLINSQDYTGEKIGYFGASTGAGAAIMAAAEADPQWPIYCIVSRGGRPDLAEKEFLNEVNVPTLLIVGSHDDPVIKLNSWAQTQILNSKLVLVPGAGHLFEEPGTLNEVVRLSADWFVTHLQTTKHKEGDPGELTH
jgi:pimeloyl-ACP methyl ester carboxylesterase